MLLRTFTQEAISVSKGHGTRRYRGGKLCKGRDQPELHSKRLLQLTPHNYEDNISALIMSKRLKPVKIGGGAWLIDPNDLDAVKVRRLVVRVKRATSKR